MAKKTIKEEEEVLQDDPSIVDINDKPNTPTVSAVESAVFGADANLLEEEKNKNFVPVPKEAWDKIMDRLNELESSQKVNKNQATPIDLHDVKDIKPEYGLTFFRDLEKNKTYLLIDFKQYDNGFGTVRNSFEKSVKNNLGQTYLETYMTVILKDITSDEVVEKEIQPIELVSSPYFITKKYPIQDIKSKPVKTDTGETTIQTSYVESGNYVKKVEGDVVKLTTLTKYHTLTFKINDVVYELPETVINLK